MAISNSQLATRVETLIQSWTRRERQYANWLGGTADGGPNGDGRYELTDGLGATRLVSCPAALAHGVSGPAALAEAAMAAAEIARDAAVSEATRSAAQTVLAEAARVAAVTARDRAERAQEEAQNAEANAKVHRDYAELAREGTAADLLGTTALHQDTQYQAAWAENWAVEAKAAADRAGNYDPSQYATRADGLAQIVGLQDALNARLPTSAFTWGNLSGKPTTFPPATHGHDWAQITGRPALMIAGDTVTIPHGSYGSGGFFLGNGDAASYTTHNFIMKGWWGMGMSDYTDTVRGFYDFRAGRWDTKGGYRVDGHDVWHRGTLTPFDINVGAEIRAYTAFRPGFNASVATANARSLEVHGEYGPDGVSGAALMTFHRPGAHAVFFGLDTDNQLKVGGWSTGANSYRLWTEQNFNPAVKMDNYHSAWIGSTDGAPRFFFGVNGRTYVRGDGVEFRNKADGVTGYIQGDGTFECMGGLSALGNTLKIRGESPTIYLKDINHRSAMIHVNDNTMYFLRGAGVDSDQWATHGDRWPLTINLENNDAVFGGAVNVKTDLLHLDGHRVPRITSGTSGGSGGQHGDIHVVY